VGLFQRPVGRKQKRGRFHLCDPAAGLPEWSSPFALRAGAIVLFVLGGTLGLSSGITMALRGKGTPIPMDSPVELVVTGPYGRLRNPMAVAGLLQGAAVGLWLGSSLVLVYVLLGAWIWHVVVRPLEEDDLSRRFGQSYEDYRKQVGCWLPSVRKYGRRE